MGRASAEGMNEQVAGGWLSLAAALEWHLQANHYPPLPVALVPVAQQAIEIAQEAIDLEDPHLWHQEIQMPDGMLYRDSEVVEVGEAVESLHLEAFLHGPEDYVEDE